MFFEIEQKNKALNNTMTKNIFILFLLTLGLLLGPTQSFAHSAKTDMTCCKKESSDSEKSCCKEKSSKETKHNCDSNCSGTSCACPVYCGFSPILTFQEVNQSFFDFSDRTQNFFYSEIDIFSDFRSIWLPPKLS